jgi:pimeloyl-ACP methyl ester carboxylesterase
MSGTPVGDVIVLLPGITGSVLQKDGEDVWAVSGGAAVNALRSRGGSIKDLRLDGDDPEADDLGDGVTAPRVIPDTHLIPGLWKIDGYGRVAKTIRDEFDVEPGVNFFEFPYDWRRDNRVHARRLARESRQWLTAWQERSGNDDAKLVLIGHSMGGLICRHFLEMLDGWRTTRLLITFGTPYRGSLNALDFIASGMRKKLGPITLLNLTEVLRSFTSVYQLLPIYACVDPGDGNLARVTEVEGIPALDAQRAADALAFHGAIRKAVEKHAQDPVYREQGYGIKPIAGIFQPTNQSMALRAGGVEMLRSYRGRDEGGDGTVPSVSATPIELSNQDREIYVRERHASLQNADHSLDQVIGLLRRQEIDQTQRFAPGTGVSLDVDDAYLTTEPVNVRALPEVEWARLTAVVQAIGDPGARVAHSTLTQGPGGWHEAQLPPLPEGTYRVTVRGDGEVNPVTDVFMVIAEGTDVET